MLDSTALDFFEILGFGPLNSIKQQEQEQAQGVE